MLHYFFDATIFTVYVIACRGPNTSLPFLENSYD